MSHTPKYHSYSYYKPKLTLEVFTVLSKGKDLFAKKDLSPFIIVKGLGMITKVSPIKVSSVSCGLKQKKKDLCIIYSSAEMLCVGAFTTNAYKAAHIIVTQRNLQQTKNRVRAILIISGVANSCTGLKGITIAEGATNYLAKKLNVSPAYVITAATGTIGVLPDINKIKHGIDMAVENLGSDWEAAAEAITTSDTKIKYAITTTNIYNKTITIAAIAKGSGMIAPNLATMLAFIATDAAINYPALKKAFRCAVDESFNMLTVDATQSTNDTAICLSTQTAQNNPIKLRTAAYKSFTTALTDICKDLARQIASDGEGTNRLIEVHVRGARTKGIARALAHAVGECELLRAGAYDSGLRFGRIAVAIGHKCKNFAPKKFQVFINDVLVGKDGVQLAYPQNLKAAEKIKIDIIMEEGAGSAVLYTCALSPKYVTLNATE